MYLSCFYKQLLKILREKTNKSVLKQKDKNKEAQACLRKEAGVVVCVKHDRVGLHAACPPAQERRTRA